MIFKNKYLKYKLKYINLKKKLNGGSEKFDNITDFQKRIRDLVGVAMKINLDPKLTNDNDKYSQEKFEERKNIYKLVGELCEENIDYVKDNIYLFKLSIGVHQQGLAKIAIKYIKAYKIYKDSDGSNFIPIEFLNNKIAKNEMDLDEEELGKPNFFRISYNLGVLSRIKDLILKQYNIINFENLKNKNTNEMLDTEIKKALKNYINSSNELISTKVKLSLDNNIDNSEIEEKNEDTSKSLFILEETIRTNLEILQSLDDLNRYLLVESINNCLSQFYYFLLNKIGFSTKTFKINLTPLETLMDKKLKELKNISMSKDITINEKEFYKIKYLDIEKIIEISINPKFVPENDKRLYIEFFSRFFKDTSTGEFMFPILAKHNFKINMNLLGTASRINLIYRMCSEEIKNIEKNKNKLNENETLKLEKLVFFKNFLDSVSDFSYLYFNFLHLSILFLNFKLANNAIFYGCSLNAYFKTQKFSNYNGFLDVPIFCLLVEQFPRISDLNDKDLNSFIEYSLPYGESKNINLLEQPLVRKNQLESISKSIISELSSFDYFLASLEKDAINIKNSVEINEIKNLISKNEKEQNVDNIVVGSLLIEKYNTIFTNLVKLGKITFWTPFFDIFLKFPTMEIFLVKILIKNPKIKNVPEDLMRDIYFSTLGIQASPNSLEFDYKDTDYVKLNEEYLKNISNIYDEFGEENIKELEKSAKEDIEKLKRKKDEEDKENKKLEEEKRIQLLEELFNDVDQKKKTNKKKKSKKKQKSNLKNIIDEDLFVNTEEDKIENETLKKEVSSEDDKSEDDISEDVNLEKDSSDDDLEVKYSEINLLQYWDKILPSKGQTKDLVKNLLNDIKDPISEVKKIIPNYEFKKNFSDNLKDYICKIILALGYITKYLKSSSTEDKVDRDLILLIKGGKALQKYISYPSDDIDLILIPNKKEYNMASLIEFAEIIINFLSWIFQDFIDFSVVKKINDDSTSVIKLQIKEKDKKYFFNILDIGVGFDYNDEQIKAIYLNQINKGNEDILQISKLKLNFYFMSLDSLIEEREYYIKKYIPEIAEIKSANRAFLMKSMEPLQNLLEVKYGEIKGKEEYDNFLQSFYK